MRTILSSCLLGILLAITTGAYAAGHHHKCGASSFCGNTSNINVYRAAIKYRPGKNVSIQQVMLGLLKANPKAFRNNNVNTYINGRALKCPTLKQITAVSKKDAAKEIARQNAEWQKCGYAGIVTECIPETEPAVAQPVVAQTQTTVQKTAAPTTTAAVSTSATVVTAKASNPTSVRDYGEVIDAADISDSDKVLLRQFAYTPEGQNFLSSIKNYVLMGPTGSSLASPIAFAQDWGMIGANLNYNRSLQHSNGDGDGAAAVGMGFGDAVKYVGVATSVIIDSLTTRNGDYFGKNGTVAVQIFRLFQDYQAAVAVGSTNLIPWGANRHDSTSYYAVGTKVFNLMDMRRPLPLTLSAGLGTGAYVSTIEYTSNKDGTVMPFASAGLKVLPTVSLIGEWVSKEVNAGVSWAPPVGVPVNINLGFINLGKWHGYSTTFMASVAVGYNFANLFGKNN